MTKQSSLAIWKPDTTSSFWISDHSSTGQKKDHSKTGMVWFSDVDCDFCPKSSIALAHEMKKQVKIEFVDLFLYIKFCKNLDCLKQKL
jgi:hypothetical protein